MEGRDHLPRPLTAEALGIGTGPVDALETGGQLLLDARDLLGRLAQLARHATDLLDIHPLDGVHRWDPLSLARAPVLRSGGPVIGVLIDSITLERAASSGHGEESPWGQRGGERLPDTGRGPSSRPCRRLPTRSTLIR